MRGRERERERVCVSCVHVHVYCVTVLCVCAYASVYVCVHTCTCMCPVCMCVVYVLLDVATSHAHHRSDTWLLYCEVLMRGGERECVGGGGCVCVFVIQMYVFMLVHCIFCCPLSLI